MKKTNLTPEYCRKAIKSWLTDAQPQSISELIAFARCTIEEDDPLLYRQHLLDLWHDATDHMRQVILIATRPAASQQWGIRHGRLGLHSPAP